MKQKKKKINQIMDFIIAHPELTSEAVVYEFDLSKEELIELYAHIKEKLPKAKERTLGKVKFFRKVLSMDILSDKERVEILMRGEFVFPDMLELHLGTACQCACVFCWRWIDRKRKEGELGLYREKKEYTPLNIDDVAGLIHEFKSHGGKILYLSGGLEFFTSKLAADTIKIASASGLIVRAYTNGVSDFFEKKENLDLILENLDYIRFSLHAFTSKTYGKIQMPHRRDGEIESEFDKVTSNIKNLIKRRIKRNLSEKCKVYLAFLALGGNYLELEDSINYWRKIGIDSFDIRVDMIGEDIWFTKKQRKEFENIMKQIKVKKKRGNYQPMEVTGERQDELHQVKFAQKCYIPLKKPTVDPWGIVFTCCYGAHPSLQHHQYYLGKYPENTLYDILKNLHNQKILPRPHCGQCTDWEMTYNQCIEKVITDWKYGFEPNRLPF